MPKEFRTAYPNELIVLLVREPGFENVRVTEQTGAYKGAVAFDYTGPDDAAWVEATLNVLDNLVVEDDRRKLFIHVTGWYENGKLVERDETA